MYVGHPGVRHKPVTTKVKMCFIHIWQFPKIRGPRYKPKSSVVLIIGTPKKVSLILGHHHIRVYTTVIGCNLDRLSPESYQLPEIEFRV